MSNLEVYQVFYSRKKGMSLGLNSFEAIQAKSQKSAKEIFQEKFPKYEVLRVVGPLRR